ncbi:MAG: NAD+ synthase [Rikenellaceae bacterium]|jgi:NAD+ synthase (glutamine-hydrolysing)|nr:NAD+ synthase [Rikenellaceae bacterium]
MKIALAQLNYTIGDFEENKAAIIDRIIRAKTHGADLVIFAEQAISGTPAFDLLNKVDFLNLCEDALTEIASHCDELTAIVGLPMQDGRQTVSVAAVLQNCAVKRYVGKQNISKREESWHLSPSRGCDYITVNNSKVAVVVGEDLTSGLSVGEQADLIVNLDANAYCRGVIEQRYERLRSTAFTNGKPLAFVNQIGGQSDVIYDGSSAVFNSRGEAIALLKSFEEDFAVVDLTARNKPIPLPFQDKTYNVYRAIKLGLKDFFVKNGFRKACLGLSGGIDSAVVLAMAAEAIGPENIKVLMMPSQFSSDHSVEDAVQMADGMRVEYSVVPITEIYTSAVDTMKPVIGGTEFDRTEENIQARIRCMLIMSLSNKYNYVLLNTSNKSECALGLGTLYGDATGTLSIIGDLYKIEVYDLARFINRRREIIPENIILKEPSAELRPQQKDGDLLPPYDVLDAIISRMVDQGQSREEIINAGFDAETVQKVYSMILRNEHKRYQFCPTLQLSARPFGRGRVMPLASKYGF